MALASALIKISLIGCVWISLTQGVDSNPLAIRLAARDVLHELSEIIEIEAQCQQESLRSFPALSRAVLNQNPCSAELKTTLRPESAAEHSAPSKPPHKAANPARRHPLAFSCSGLG
jgi:hypothetical protein